MDRTVKISVTAGDVEIDHEGSAPAIGEMLAILRQDDSWSIMIERLKVAKNAVMETNKSSKKGAGDAGRGADFAALIENCSLKRKPEQVLGAIHYLREIERVMDSPPRIINQLFEDAGMEAPGNLSLYLNRLRERNFLVIPDGSEDKNRFAVLSDEGRAHLDKNAGK